jgi:ribosomal protein S18 acetylase RimI-like enzyme
VTTPVYRITRLAPSFDLGAFDCGEPAYNEWIVQHAANAVEAGSSMVYLLLEQVNPGAEERVAGYYAICPTMVVRDDMPKPRQRGVPRAAPAWLLAKLALDKSLRSDKDHQWGTQLLREALEKIVASVDLGGGQIIVVDADNPGLIAWYSRQGFKSTGGQDLRLYLKVATARKYLEQK